MRAPALFVLVASSCVHSPSAPAGWTEPTPAHTSRFVTVEKGVSLEVLDWGGVGPPVLFVAGLSHSAHVFDDFAPALTNTFHVYGVTRRGWGLSSVPETGYALPRLVDDLVQTLDALGVKRVSLVGHSAGGEELTAFAAAHPDRVERLVYLDAAYDRSGPDTEADGLGDCSNVAPPVEADLATAEAFGAWFNRSRRTVLPPSEMHTLFDHHGPSEAGAGEYMQSLKAPDYTRVQAPALAIYAVPTSAADFFPAWPTMDEPTRAHAQRCFEHGREQAVGKASRADFKAHAPHGQVLELLHAGHYVYVTNREEVLTAVRAFLTHT